LLAALALLRFILTSNGSINVDGRALSDTNLDAIRSRLTLVPQVRPSSSLAPSCRTPDVLAAPAGPYPLLRHPSLQPRPARHAGRLGPLGGAEAQRLCARRRRRQRGGRRDRARHRGRERREQLLAGSATARRPREGACEEQQGHHHGRSECVPSPFSLALGRRGRTLTLGTHSLQRRASTTSRTNSCSASSARSSRAAPT